MNSSNYKNDDKPIGCSCPLCGKPAEGQYCGRYKLSCKECGDYTITSINPVRNEELWKVSCICREASLHKRECHISFDDAGDILVDGVAVKKKFPGGEEKTMRALVNLYLFLKGQYVFSYKDIPAYTVFSQTEQKRNQMLDRLERKGFLKRSDENFMPIRYRLSDSGYKEAVFRFRGINSSET